MRSKKTPESGKLLIIPSERDLQVPTYVMDENDELQKRESIPPLTFALTTGNSRRIGNIINLFIEVIIPGIGVRLINTSHLISITHLNVQKTQVKLKKFDNRN
jgi:hypothetical protein